MPLSPLARKKITLGFLALAGVPLLMLIDTAIGLLRGWTITYRQEQAILTGFAVLLLVALALVSRPRGRGFLERRWALLLALAIVLVLGAIVLELVARATLVDTTPFHLRVPNTQAHFHPNPDIMPGVSGDSAYSTNAQGVRGPEMPPRDKAYRILCVGGSTTECLYLDDSEAWTRLLMDDLNNPKPPAMGRDSWAGGAGSSGMAADGHAAFIRDSPLIGEVDCVVMLVGINDMSKALLPETSGGGVLERPELVGRPLWRRSVALINAGQIVRNLKQRMKGGIAVEDAGGASYISRRERRQNAKIVDTIPPLDTAIERYRANLQAITETCRAKKVRLVFVTQPVLWDANLSEAGQKLLWFGWLSDGSYASVGALRQSMDRFNDELRRHCAEEGVPCIELSSMNGRIEFFLDDCHFNEAGSREVASLIAQWFAQPLPPSPQ